MKFLAADKLELLFILKFFSSPPPIFGLCNRFDRKIHSSLTMSGLWLDFKVRIFRLLDKVRIFRLFETRISGFIMWWTNHVIRSMYYIRTMYNTTHVLGNQEIRTVNVKLTW